MSDGELFYLVFALIYLGECIVWAGRRSVPFVTSFVRRHRPQRASGNIGSASSGGVMLNPFPPLGGVYLSELWPISLTADGFSTQMRDTPNPGARPPRPRHHFRWQDVELVGTQGRFVYVNGERVVGLCSPNQANRMADLLRQLRDSDDKSERATQIERALDHALCVRQVEKRHRWFTSRAMWPRIDCIMLFLVAFLMVPFAYWRFESAPQFWWTLGVMWLLMLKISVEFFCLHRRLFPALSSERWQYFIFSVFVPQFTIRAVDALSKPWLANYHPLAIARAVSTPKQAARFVPTVLRDMNHPLPMADPGDDLASEFHAQFLRPAVERFCQAEGIEIAEVDAPPPAESIEPGCERYCPRCFTQYDATAESCGDCGEMPTLAIAALDSSSVE